MKVAASPILFLLAVSILCLSGPVVAQDDAVAYRTNPAHTGQNTMPGFTLPLAVNWDVDLGQPVSYPLIADGKVYVITSSGSTNQLTALDAETGQGVWGPINLPPYFYFGAAAAYENGMVFVSQEEPDLNLEGGLMLAYNAQTGAMEWSTYYPSQWWMEDSPTALNGYVYVIGASSIRETDGNVIWALPATGETGAPAVTPAAIYISAACGNSCDLDPATGNVIWSLSAGCNGGGGSTPAFYNGNLFIQGYYAGGSSPFTDAAVDGSTGAVESTFPQQGPVALDNSLLFGVVNSSLIATKLSDWSNAWTANNTADPPLTAPTVVNGVVYVASRGGYLYGYDENVGAAVASVNLNEIPSATVESATDIGVGDGLIVIPCGTHLVAVGSPSLQILSVTPNPVFAGGTGFTLTVNGQSFSPGATVEWNGTALATTWVNATQLTASVPAEDIASIGSANITAVNPDTGTSNTVTLSINGNPSALSAFAGDNQVGLTWTNLTGASSYNVYRGTSPGEEILYQTSVVRSPWDDLAANNGTTYYYTVTAINGESESTPSNEASATPEAPTPLATEDAVTYRTNPAHTGQNTMPDIRLPLAKWWDVDLGQNASYPLIAGGKVYVISASEENYPQLTALDAATGKMVWGPKTISPSYYNWSADACYDNGKVFVSQDGQYLGGIMSAYDARTGALDWSIYCPGVAWSDSLPTALNGFVYAQMYGDASCIRELDGNIMWSTPGLSADSGGLAVTPTGLFSSGTCGDSYELDPGTGNIVWTLTGQCYGSSGETPAYYGGELFIEQYVAQSYDPQMGSEAALNASTGAIVNTFTENAPFAFDNGLLFGVSNFTLMTTKLSDWSSAWRANNGIDLPVTAPTVVNGNVYVASQGGCLYGYDENTGALVANVNLGETPSPTTESFIDIGAGDGLIVVPCGTHLVAVGNTILRIANLAPNPVFAGGPGFTLTVNGSSFQSGAKVEWNGIPLPTTWVSSIQLTANVPANHIATVGLAHIRVVNPDSSATGSVSLNIVPGPSSLQAAAADNVVMLIWKASPDATGCNLYRGTSAGGETLYQSGVTGTSFLDTYLANGTTLYYRVTAVNGSGESQPSNEVNAEPLAVPPSAPKGLAAVAGNARVSLSWTALGATSYNLYRSKVPGGETLFFAGLTDSEFFDASVLDGTTYYYKVKAIDNVGVSVYSNEVSAKPHPPAPPTPTGVVATGGVNQISLSWTALPEAASYRIYRGRTPGGETLYVSGVTTAGYVDRLVSAGATYYYKIIAVNAYGASPFSSEVSAIPER